MQNLHLLKPPTQPKLLGRPSAREFTVLDVIVRWLAAAPGKWKLFETADPTMRMCDCCSWQRKLLVAASKKGRYICMIVCCCWQRISLAVDPDKRKMISSCSWRRKMIDSCSWQRNINGSFSWQRKNFGTSSWQKKKIIRNWCCSWQMEIICSCSWIR